jgi:hypothetical protein
MDINKIAEELFSEYNLDGWTLRIATGGNMCWHSRKRIDILENCSQDIAMFLHELAHALTPNAQLPNFHDWEWADCFTRLVSKHTKS